MDVYSKSVTELARHLQTAKDILNDEFKQVAEDYQRLDARQRQQLDRSVRQIRTRMLETEDRLQGRLGEISHESPSVALAVPDAVRNGHGWPVTKALLWSFIWAAVLYAALAVPWFSKPTETTGLTSTLYDTRVYLARVTGTIPVECFADTTTTSAHGGSCDWLEGRDASIDFGFREDDLLAFWRPDVGLFQKVTLFLFIYGWLNSLNRVRNDNELALSYFGDTAPVLFPKRDVTATGGKLTQTQAPVDVKKTRQRSIRPHDPSDAAGEDGGVLVYDPFPMFVETVRVFSDETNSDHQVRGTLLARTVAMCHRVISEGTSTSNMAEMGRIAENAEKQFREEALDRFWMVEYLVWLIPTIGFLGTIYGISGSLLEARDIVNSGSEAADPEQFASVVDALGTAFDTTAFALALVAWLMFLKMRTQTDTSLLVGELVAKVRSNVLDRVRGDPYSSDLGVLSEANKRIEQLIDLRIDIARRGTARNANPH